ncbi:hypothetical protein HPB48_011177 [Haemaphysalis longicornis]|uniref:Uncharacterized protein n=1 Tax=Haemaphysalis longicornis TaxID=44386 RepID=A0A9J6GTC6_HAELO|nr:hypothetical protein HPB48_011177 [Haemaphysalis longicornis]
MLRLPRSRTPRRRVAKPGHRESAVCGLSNPMKKHVCTRRCVLCKGAHRTGNKRCLERPVPRSPPSHRQANTKTEEAPSTMTSHDPYPKDLPQPERAIGPVPKGSLPNSNQLPWSRADAVNATEMAR